MRGIERSMLETWGLVGSKEGQESGGVWDYVRFLVFRCWGLFLLFEKVVIVALVM
jgi:hypothetical protein